MRARETAQGILAASRKACQGALDHDDLKQRLGTSFSEHVVATLKLRRLGIVDAAALNSLKREFWGWAQIAVGVMGVPQLPQYPFDRIVEAEVERYLKTTKKVPLRPARAAPEPEVAVVGPSQEDLLRSQTLGGVLGYEA